MGRQATREIILKHRAGAIIRTEDQQQAHDAMRAAVTGGFKLVEFTLTTPGAFELIQQFSSQDGIVVGAGTVLTVEQAERSVQAGARFLVSPICDPVIIRKAAELDAVCIPGTFTATEMQTAHLAGADFVKLFPAPADVPTYVKAILGPLPHLRIYPTNGVDLDNAAAVLQAGAAGVGFVTGLFEPRWVQERNWDAIEQRARALLKAVDSA